MGKKIRVPATTVELVQILGTILRDHIELQLCETECWTFEFEHVADWQIRGEEPDQDASEEEWALFDLWENPEHQMSVYLGSGYCTVKEYGDDPKRLDLRIRCEYSKWIACALSYWDFQIWIRLPDGSLERHHYVCHLGYGKDRDIFPEEESKMPLHPPRKIAFWKGHAAA